MKKLLGVVFVLVFAMFGTFVAMDKAMTAQTVIESNHFEGGKNLAKGNKLRKDSKHLAVIVSDIQSGLNSSDTSLALKLDSLKLVVYSSAASISGDATQALVVTGLGASDAILAVSQKVKGANSLPLLGYQTQIANGLTVVYSANPGAGAIVEVLVKKP